MKSFSLIVPVYNCSRYIVECINSLLKACIDSTFSCEIILIDDGSFDGSAALIEQVLATDTYNLIRVIHQQNRGVSNARNVGIEYAVGEYILFIDADDTVFPEKLAECMRLIIADDQIDMFVYGMSVEYYYRKKCYHKKENIPPYQGIKTKKECVDQINLLFDSNCLSSMCLRIIKTERLARLFLQEDMFIYEDLELSLRVLNRCSNIYFFPECVYRYRQTESENNAVNRLKKIGRIQPIIDRIDIALDNITQDKEHILCAVYNMLVIDKVRGSDWNGIKRACEEYRKWINNTGYKEVNRKIYSCRFFEIIIYLYYRKLRRIIVKSMRHLFKIRQDKETAR